jgi:DNA repair exonuclease SbcCD ATPase subunit
MPEQISAQQFKEHTDRMKNLQTLANKYIHEDVEELIQKIDRAVEELRTPLEHFRKQRVQLEPISANLNNANVNHDSQAPTAKLNKMIQGFQHILADFKNGNFQDPNIYDELDLDHGKIPLQKYAEELKTYFSNLDAPSAIVTQIETILSKTTSFHDGICTEITDDIKAMLQNLEGLTEDKQQNRGRTPS